MNYIALNALPIFAAAAASLAFGFLWLAVFDRREAGARPSAGFLAVVAAAEFWLAAILAGALILAPPQAGAWTMAIMTPVVIWAGFVLPALVVTLPLRGLGLRTVLVDCGLWLGSMLIQAATLHAIGLVPPAQG